VWSSSIYINFVRLIVSKFAPPFGSLCFIDLYRNIYHTPVPILRLCKYGIARPCIYFDVTSLALYKQRVKTDLNKNIKVLPLVLKMAPSWRSYIYDIAVIFDVILVAILLLLLCLRSNKSKKYM
jgi:hypothetical protein